MIYQVMDARKNFQTLCSGVQRIVDEMLRYREDPPESRECSKQT